MSIKIKVKTQEGMFYVSKSLLSLFIVLKTKNFPVDDFSRKLCGLPCLVLLEVLRILAAFYIQHTTNSIRLLPETVERE